MYSAAGAAVRMTAPTTAACTRPDTGERPPARMLAAVRARAPVAGRQPKAAQAMLATPWGRGRSACVRGLVIC